MGLFDSGDVNPEAQRLADSARGKSVTAKILTKTTGGVGSFSVQSILADSPFLNILNENEQPHYYFANNSKGQIRDGDAVGAGHQQDFMSTFFVTDQRIILTAAGNRGNALVYGSITDVQTKNGLTKNRLSVFTSNHEYRMYIPNSATQSEIEAAADYIRTQAKDAPTVNSDLDTVHSLRPIWDDTMRTGAGNTDPLDATPQGAYVNQERVDKIRDILDPDERVHYLTRGQTVDVEGSGAGSSWWGNDRSRKQGTRGYVRAAATNKRVVVKIPQFTGTDERSVPYQSITSVDLDAGLGGKRITLQTPGQTYHIQANFPGKPEVREMTRFIREQITGDTTTVTSTASTETDPLEQLEKLGELRDNGVLSEEEFEEKKADLLDEI